MEKGRRRTVGMNTSKIPWWCISDSFISPPSVCIFPEHIPSPKIRQLSVLESRSEAAGLTPLMCFHLAVSHQAGGPTPSNERSTRQGLRTAGHHGSRTRRCQSKTGGRQQSVPAKDRKVIKLAAASITSLPSATIIVNGLLADLAQFYQRII